MNQTVIPEGRGKAKAIETFLATGGGTVSRGSQRNPNFKYQKGALAGKTYDEAFAEGERRWQGASPSIKDKYARMGGNAGTLAPSEMDEYQAQLAETGDGGTGTNPQPGVVYGSPANMPGKPFSQSNLAQGTVATTPTAIKKPALNGAETEGPMTSQERRMKQYSDSRANRMAQYGYAPNGKTFSQNKAEEEARKKKESGASAPEQMGPPKSAMNPPTSAPGDASNAAILKDGAQRMATGSGGGDYRTADTGDGGMAAAVAMEEKAAKMPQGKPFTGIEQQGPPKSAMNAPTNSPLAQRELARRREAISQTPTGAPVMSRQVRDETREGMGVRINRLTGLPGGFMPGDKIPGADPGMQGRADASVKRQEIATSKAAMGKPFTGIGQPQSQPSGFAVPRAKMLTQEDADAARQRQNTMGGTIDSDRKDATLRVEFGKQQDAAKAKEYGKNRLANTQARKAGSPNYSM